MRRVTVSRPAQRDLMLLRLWLSQPGAGPASMRRREAISSAIAELAHTPARWPVVDHPNIRERSVAGYRVIYEVRPDTGSNRTSGNVRILRVFGPGQDRSDL